MLAKSFVLFVMQNDFNVLIISKKNLLILLVKNKFYHQALLKIDFQKSKVRTPEKNFTKPKIINSKKHKAKKKTKNE